MFLAQALQTHEHQQLRGDHKAVILLVDLWVGLGPVVKPMCQLPTATMATMADSDRSHSLLLDSSLGIPIPRIRAPIPRPEKR